MESTNTNNLSTAQTHKLKFFGASGTSEFYGVTRVSNGTWTLQNILFCKKITQKHIWYSNYSDIINISWKNCHFWHVSNQTDCELPRKWSFGYVNFKKQYPNYIRERRKKLAVGHVKL